VGIVGNRCVCCGYCREKCVYAVVTVGNSACVCAVGTVGKSGCVLWEL